MSVQEFVAAAEKADSSLKGSDAKAQAAIQKLNDEVAGLAKDIPALNTRLSPLTYLHSNQPSTADVGLYCHLHPTFKTVQPSSHPEHPAVTRYFLHVQSLPPVQSAQASTSTFEPISIDISSLPPPPRQVIDLKKEKKAKKDAAAQPPAEGIVAQASAAVSGAASSAAATVSGAAAAAVASVTATAEGVKAAVVGDEKEVKGKGEKKQKEKKEKPAKAPAVKEEPTGPLPSMIDLRVGKVLDVKKHPEADSLYVETIDVGEEEPRTVCSGLVKYMKEEQIQGATVIVVCNLKPVSMRGVKSFAMLLCASSKDGKEEGGVEFVLPPEGSKAGERVYFEGEKYESATPEPQLNPKKKVFETIQPGFTTLDTREAVWIDPATQSVHKIRTKDGVCKAQTMKRASLS